MFPLRLNSYYSLMRGVMSPEVLCKKAREFGYTGVAMTDRNNLYGLWSFLPACKRWGLKPIIGAEVGDPETGRMVTCLVRDSTGYANLCKLITLYHNKEDFLIEEEISHHAQGLILLIKDVVLCGQLLSHGIIPVFDLGSRPDQAAARLRNWAGKLGVRAVATHATGAGSKEDLDLYSLLRAIDRNLSLSEAVEKEGRQDEYFADPQVYKKRFAMWPEVVNESYRIAEECTFTGPEFGLVMPPWRGVSARETLREWAYRGAEKRYGTDLSEVVVERLEHELGVIEKMGFSSYFLVVRNIVHRQEGDGKRKLRRICGRGSGAASLVAYCLEITNVCPIKYNLYFERFLNPGRKDPPDIDVDFSWDERDEVLNEVLQDHDGYAAMVCNHIFFKPRMAIRETAKAYGMPGYEISRVTKKLPWFHKSDGDLFEQVEKMPTLQGANLNEPWPTIIRLAARLIGLPRHLSVHPGGVVITPEKIARYVPVEQASKGVPIIQWEKDGTEEAGLVKIDLLGNRSLGVIRDCLDSVRSRGVIIPEESWEPDEDLLTQERVAEGKTMGCFYIESPAMRLLQQKAGSGSYEQLVLQSSIIRPAANEFVREYVRRLHGGTWEPLHEKLGDVLDETFGLMVYQEDVSRVAVHLAGFSHAKADGLRKIMSKKDKQHKLLDYKKDFFSGCLKNQVNLESIEKMWDMMMSFDGYSFCKPHSASYARVSFQAAYLKTYFPAEFMAAVISNQGGYYSAFGYVSEAKRMGVSILHPDVNLSEKRWKGRDLRIRVGLQTIHGLSEKSMEAICKARTQKNFTCLNDFLHRTAVAEDEVKALIHAGAFDSLRPERNRATLLWELARYKREQQSEKRMPLFTVTLPDPPKLPQPSRAKSLRMEYEVLGFLCQTHPITLFQQKAKGRVISLHIKKHVGRVINFAGWLLTGKLVSTKTGEAMEFLTFEDEFGLVETTFFPKVYHRYANILQTGRGYMLQGLVEEDFGAITLTVKSISALTSNSYKEKTERMPAL